MKTSDFLRQHDACREGAKWALSVSTDMADVWDALIEQGKHEWLIWTATRPGVFPGTTLRKLACRFVRETPLLDGRKVWDLLTDERSQKAVAVAERYADGKATGDELKAARAAYATATDAAAEAAACAACAAYVSYAADVYATEVADAAYGSAYAARAAAYASAEAVAYVVADAATDAAKSAQVKMMAELGNPFRKENDND